MTSFTDEDYLPHPDEVTIEELPVTWGPLKAASLQLGKFCEFESNEFMLCKQETGDPRKCLQEGRDVTACGHRFLQRLKETCYEEFTSFWRCMDQKQWTRFNEYVFYYWFH